MGSSMPNEPKRYLAAIRLADDVPLDQLGRRIEGLRQLVSNLANGDVHLAFSSDPRREFVKSGDKPAKNGMIPRQEARVPRWDMTGPF